MRDVTNGCIVVVVVGAIIAFIVGLIWDAYGSLSETEKVVFMSVFAWVIIGIGIIVAITLIVNFIIKPLVYQKERAKYTLSNDFILERSKIDKERKDFAISVANEKAELEKEREYLSELESKLDLREDLLGKRLAMAPEIASMVADLLDLQLSEDELYLRTKPHPAIKAANDVAKLKNHFKLLEYELKLTKYQLEAFEAIFPWLENYKEITEEDIIALYNAQVETEEDDEDEIDEYETLKYWLSKEEYKSLSDVEKYQRALDRYLNRTNKTNWQVGIEYERYIGYQFEKDGMSVEYYGAKHGLEDRGIDLIITDKKKNMVVLVQCKRWREDRTVRENHIFQLYGSLVLYGILNKQKNTQLSFLDGSTVQDSETEIKAMIYTTTTLSNYARECAEALNIAVCENDVFKNNYPCIKCNINQTSGERIYHLPFDQQYDRVKIIPALGEMYVSTVAEAEANGFRRAKRHSFNADNGELML